jgi:amphi-Trp domain-containing protein
MTKNNFSHKVVTDPLDSARFLEAIIEGMRQGHLTLSSKNHQITLKPGEIIDLTIETSNRKGKIGLNIGFSWTEIKTHQQQSLPLDPFQESEKRPDLHVK